MHELDSENKIQALISIMKMWRGGVRCKIQRRRDNLKLYTCICPRTDSFHNYRFREHREMKERKKCKEESSEVKIISRLFVDGTTVTAVSTDECE